MPIWLMWSDSHLERAQASARDARNKAGLTVQVVAFCSQSANFLSKICYPSVPGSAAPRSTIRVRSGASMWCEGDQDRDHKRLPLPRALSKPLFIFTTSKSLIQQQPHPEDLSRSRSADRGITRNLSRHPRDRVDLQTQTGHGGNHHVTIHSKENDQDDSRLTPYKLHIKLRTPN